MSIEQIGTENNLEKVSVIIPTYNRSTLLVKAIKSLQSQSYKNIEIIVVDDCSIDDTSKVVKKFNDERIIYVRHDINKGGSEARNTGIKMATGKYIAFLDSDDQWLPEKIEKQLLIFQQNTETGLVYTGLKIINEIGLTKISVPEFRGKLLSRLLESNCIDTTSSIVVRKDLLLKVGGFDTSLPSCQDWDLYIRLANVTEFDYVKDPLVLFYQHDGERISTNNNSVVNGHLSIYEKYSSLALELGKNVYYNFLSNIFKKIYKVGINYQNKKSIGISRKIIKDGLKNVGICKMPLLFIYISTFVNIKLLSLMFRLYKKNLK